MTRCSTSPPDRGRRRARGSGSPTSSAPRTHAHERLAPGSARRATHSPLSRSPYSASGLTAAATFAGSVQGVVVQTTSDSPGRSSSGKRTKSDGIAPLLVDAALRQLVLRDRRAAARAPLRRAVTEVEPAALVHELEEPPDVLDVRVAEREVVTSPVHPLTEADRPVGQRSRRPARPPRGIAARTRRARTPRSRASS